jgi:hypothetical protein
MLIGICGKAGAGKDTIGDYLVKKYNFKKIALADPIKRIVKDVFVLDDHTVYDRVEREKELENWKGWSVRKLLQFIGTELFRNNIDDSVWVKSLWYRIKNDADNNYVVTDIRFPNELKYFNWWFYFLPLIFLQPIFSNFHHGQTYLLVTALLFEFYIAFNNKKNVNIGWIIALLFALKIFPAFIAILLVFKKEWKALQWIILFSASLGLICYFTIGPETLNYYYIKVSTNIKSSPLKLL